MREHVVDHCNRGDAANRLSERQLRFWRRDSTGLQAKQRCHSLQIVFDPVVNLANARFLGEQSAITTAKLSYITDQDHRATVVPLTLEREADRSHGTRGIFEFHAARCTSTEYESDGFIDRTGAVRKPRARDSEAHPHQIRR